MACRVDNNGIPPWVTVLFVILFIFCVLKTIDSVYVNKKVTEPETKKPVWTGQ